jgi:hypothetical protein
MKKEKAKRADLISVKILREDAKKVKLWAIQREMKFYQLMSILIKK